MTDPAGKIPAIAINNLCKTFRSCKALDSINLHIAPAEMIALIGPSGSGKSTLLRHICGLVAGDNHASSQVAVFGKTAQKNGTVAGDIRKMFNDKLAQLRRHLQAEAEEAHQKVLKGTRWLLLKNPENLNHQKNEHQRLQKALELNQPLATAYYLKEELRQLWSQKTKKKAATVLSNWIAMAKSAGIKILSQLARSVAEHADGILAYYDYRISTGPLEGTNNKIKTLQRQAYGFRDRMFFILKIYSLHTSKYALIG